MNKKLKVLMVALGVASILVISFAGVAMAAGQAGSADCTQDCIQSGDRLQECDPVNDQARNGGQLRTQAQDCDLVPDQVGDGGQVRAGGQLGTPLQDCIR